MYRLNKKAKGRFFEEEEILIAFLSAFLSGFPGFLLFVFGIVVVYFIVHLINAIIRKSATGNVVPLYHFWLPVASFVIITEMVWLSKLEFWSLLSI